MRVILAGLCASALIVSLGVRPVHAQVVVSGTIGSAETDLDPEQEQRLLGEYWSIAKRYKVEPERAIKEMTGWTRDRVGKAQAIQYQPETGKRPEYLESKAEWNPPTLRLAAMLHSDLGLAALRTRNLQEFDFQMGIADGWLALADNRQSSPGSLRSKWNVTVARLLLANGETGVAERMLMRINERIGNDIAILLTYGTVKETQATRAFAAYGTRLDEPALAQKERNASLAQAISLLEKVIALEPGIGEAKLRLAHLYILKNDHQKAEALLLPLLLRPQPPVTKYLASMFLGQARESMQQFDNAARAYLDAMNAVPDAQSAYVALAHVLHRSGEPAEAAAVMNRLFARGTASQSSDPWWIYPLGLDLSFDARFEEFRADVRR